jgi:transposase
LEVKRLKSKGHSIRSIYRQTGIHRQTIKRYLAYEDYPEKIIGGSKTSKALPFEDYLRKRWAEGETSHMQLWRKIKEQGFTGSSQSVYRFVCKYPRDRSCKNLPPPLKIKIWSPRKVSLLMSKPFEQLDEGSQDFLRAFYKRCPQANKASQLARKFKNMTDRLIRKHLDPWIKQTLESGIPSLKKFAKGLQQDYDAVKAAVSLKWSNGQVEGQVNRLKNIKRQMYGRAGFELLRKRVLMDSS